MGFTLLLLFGLHFIGQILTLFDLQLEEKCQIVSKTLEDPVRLLRLFGAGPALSLLHLTFKLMEYFFNIPALLIH